MRKILLRYILLNKKNFIILITIFIIGLFCGVILVNNSSKYQKNEITLEINNLITSIKESTSINRLDLLMLSLKRNCTLILIIWLLGCTIIGGIFIYLAILYEGFLLGYTMSALIAVLGVRNGILFSITSLLIQNLIFIPAILLISENGIKLYKGLYNKCINIKEEVIRHTMIMFISIMLSIISSILEVYISMNILMFFKEIL